MSYIDTMLLLPAGIIAAFAIVISSLSIVLFIGYVLGRKAAQRDALREIDAFYKEASQIIRKESD